MSASNLPPLRPQWEEDRVRRYLAEAGLGTAPLALLGVRGYYRDSMGQKGANDRGIYDDAMFVVTPTACVAFNANTDPSVRRPGIAVLAPGVWEYQLGIHGMSKPVKRRYRALIQARPVTVVRDGGKVETGMFGINIHRGSLTTTSSEGCQTIPPAQWVSFFGLVEQVMGEQGMASVPYVLVEAQG